MRNLLATSFLENKRYGLQARQQGFPKLCPTLSESQYRAISWACNEASNLGGRIYATVPWILLNTGEAGDFDKLLGDGATREIADMLRLRFNMYGRQPAGQKVGLLDR